jgi:hypothetical protein
VLVFSFLHHLHGNSVSNSVSSNVSPGTASLFLSVLKHSCAFAFIRLLLHTNGSHKHSMAAASSRRSSVSTLDDSRDNGNIRIMRVIAAKPLACDYGAGWHRVGGLLSLAL